jgi:hypothetical protein
MDNLITVILSSSSVGVVMLFITYYLCRRCRQSECTAHMQDANGNHFDLSVGTPSAKAPTEHNTHSSASHPPIEETKAEIV